MIDPMSTSGGPVRSRRLADTRATAQAVRRTVTALDVARAAGVSKWTVTRAFTPGVSIAEASRRRVMAAAEGLGYRPNLLARSLATRSTQQVAVLVDDFANPHKLPFLETLTASLQAAGLLAVLININESYGHVGALMEADQRQVDAAVLLGTDFRDEMLLEGGRQVSAPDLYVLARESTIASIPSVSCDARASIEEIGRHLLNRGYRRPGVRSGPPSGGARAWASCWRSRPVPTADRQARRRCGPTCRAPRLESASTF
jgi:LacI family transcriptional regulator